MKTRFWSSDWFAGLIITILVAVFSGSASFQSLELSAYDRGLWIQICALILTGLYLMLIMPRIKAGVGFVLTLALLMTLVVAHYILMTSSTIWIPLMTPAVLLAIGYALITTKRFLVTERSRTKSDDESSESNRMLGIAIQGQGQLDSARWMKR